MTVWRLPLYLRARPALLQSSPKRLGPPPSSSPCCWPVWLRSPASRAAAHLRAATQVWWPLALVLLGLLLLATVGSFRLRGRWEAGQEGRPSSSTRCGAQPGAGAGPRRLPRAGRLLMPWESLRSTPWRSCLSGLLALPGSWAGRGTAAAWALGVGPPVISQLWPALRTERSRLWRRPPPCWCCWRPRSWRFHSARCPDRAQTSWSPRSDPERRLAGLSWGWWHARQYWTLGWVLVVQACWLVALLAPPWSPRACARGSWSRAAPLAAAAQDPGRRPLPVCLPVLLHLRPEAAPEGVPGSGEGAGKGPEGTGVRRRARAALAAAVRPLRVGLRAARRRRRPGPGRVAAVTPGRGGSRNPAGDGPDPVAAAARSPAVSPGGGTGGADRPLPGGAGDLIHRACSVPSRGFAGVLRLRTPMRRQGARSFVVTHLQMRSSSFHPFLRLDARTAASGCLHNPLPDPRNRTLVQSTFVPNSSGALTAVVVSGGKQTGWPQRPRSVDRVAAEPGPGCPLDRVLRWPTRRAQKRCRPAASSAGERDSGDRRAVAPP